MDLSWDLAAQLAWTGLASSSPYWLFTLAFALVLKVNRVWNFAAAGLMVVAYYTMFLALRTGGLPLPLGIASGVVVTALAAYAIEQFGFRKLRERKSGILAYFIFTVTLAQFTIYAAELLFGTDPKTLFPSILSPVSLVGPIVVSRWDLTALATACGMTVCLALLLRRSKIGKEMIAVADAPELAQFYGIDTARAYAVAASVSGVLIAAGMYLVGTKASVVPSAPLNQFLISAVIATILAGLGNVFAAGLAAVALSLLAAFSITVISSRWQPMISYVLIFVVIILFPRGVRFSPLALLPRRKPAPHPNPAKRKLADAG